MSERYVQINIGEGGLPQDEDWQKFVNETVFALENSTRGDFPNIEVHTGEGRWAESAELSAHISTVADVDTYALRVRLRELKTKYNQEAIALIVGSDLI